MRTTVAGLKIVFFKYLQTKWFWFPDFSLASLPLLLAVSAEMYKKLNVDKCLNHLIYNILFPLH